MIIIFIILFFISLGINYLQFKFNEKKDRIIEIKDKFIQQALENVNHISAYNESIKNIKKNHKEISKQIREANTDEEINNIICNIIDNNNKHMHND